MFANPYLDQRELNGFLYLQASMDRALATYYHPNSEPPQTVARVKPFPYPKHKQNTWAVTGQWIIRIFIGLLSNMGLLSGVILDLVLEKAERQRLMMRMMGASSLDIWCSWAIKWVVITLVMATLVSIALTAGDLAYFQFTDGFIFFLFQYVFYLNVVAYGFFMSTLFNSTTTGTIFGSVVFYLLYLPWDTLASPNKETRYRPIDDLTASSKKLLALSPPSAYGLGIDIMVRYEKYGRGVEWDTIGVGLDGNSCGVADVMGMLILTTTIFLVLTWYIDQVSPGKHGVPPKPLLFFLERNRSSGPTAPAVRIDGDNSAVPSTSDDEIGIKVRGLVKQFNTPSGIKVAVDHLDLDVRKGEITALLGHSGAGKTTAMTVMCGLYRPTKGSVLVNGKDVVFDWGGARESLGFCPQFDVIWEPLTVEEHLDLYCRLKGMTDAAAIQKEVDVFIKDIHLEPKRNDNAGKLSIDEKRGLSCCIGLIGGSKTVILDEPVTRHHLDRPL
jgi:ABC-type lipopolysaccharide export system ATPase subunit